jgi:hypothetical protein
MMIAVIISPATGSATTTPQSIERQPAKQNAR